MVAREAFVRLDIADVDSQIGDSRIGRTASLLYAAAVDA